MKKRFLSLILVLALLLSCVLALTSCPDSGDNNDPPASNPELDLDESTPGGAGSQGVGVITDPTSPEAGADADSKYESDK